MLLELYHLLCVHKVLGSIPSRGDLSKREARTGRETASVRLRDCAKVPELLRICRLLLPRPRASQLITFTKATGLLKLRSSPWEQPSIRPLRRRRNEQSLCQPLRMRSFDNTGHRPLPLNGSKPENPGAG